MLKIDFVYAVYSLFTANEMFHTNVTPKIVSPYTKSTISQNPRKRCILLYALLKSLKPYSRCFRKVSKNYG